MGSTTAPMSIRYPEPTENLRDAATAMRIMAEDIKGHFNGDVCVVARAESATESASGAPVNVSFPGTHVALAGFTFDGVTLTRTGAAQTFLVDVEVTAEVGSPTGLGQATSSVEIVANGSPYAGSTDHLSLTENTIGQRYVTHRVTSPVALGPGDTITVNLAGTAGVRAGITGLRVYSTSPEIR